MEARVQDQTRSPGRNGVSAQWRDARLSAAGAIGFPRARPSFDTVMPRELGTMAVTGGAAEKKSHAHI
jgi:hypothetical protein